MMRLIQCKTTLKPEIIQSDMSIKWVDMSTTIANLFFTMSFFLMVSQSSGTETCDDPQTTSLEAKLQEKVFCGYNPEIRPVKDHTTSVKVTIYAMLRSIELHTQWDVTDTLTAMMHMHLMWNDEYLRWKPADFGGIRYTMVAAHTIWTPELRVPNSQYSVNTVAPSTCMVEYDGDISCMMSDSHSVICDNDYTDWPFDRQNCSIRFRSVQNRGKLVDFSVPTKNFVFKSFYVPSKYWELLKSGGEYSPGIVRYTNETFPSITYWFYLQRHSSKAMALILPAAFAMIFLTVLALCLEITSPNRMTLLMFNVIVHSLSNALIVYNSPDNGNSVPHVVRFFRDALYLSYMVLAHGILMRWIVKKNTVTPNWINIVVDITKTNAGKIIFNEFDPDNTVATEEDAESLVKNDGGKTQWKMFAIFLDRLALIVACLVYLILLLRFVF